MNKTVNMNETQCQSIVFQEKHQSKKEEKCSTKRRKDEKKRKHLHKNAKSKWL